MGTIELKNKVVDIINSSDERFLRMVNALHKSYYQETTDLFEELPLEIQELLMESIAQTDRGEVTPHAEVMAEVRKKYNLVK